MPKPNAHSKDDQPAYHSLGAAILLLLNHAPLPRTERSATPREAAHGVAQLAAGKAALAAGALALPPGPLGWLTVLPELVTVWKIQAQMVADIAGLYGVTHAPGTADMLHCLFRHASAQVMRDLGVRLGERLVVQELSVQALQRLSRAVGLRLSQRALASGASRWMPVIGALGVGAYAWNDTRQVAGTAMEWFGAQMQDASVTSDRSATTELPLVERIS
jgi:hypothetical protein